MIKRLIDFCFSLVGIIILFPAFILMALLAGLDTSSNGFFCQKRIGLNGKLFWILKISSLQKETKSMSSFGKFLRKFKLDELPQLINILKGDMTFVGPRPDIPGYADELVGEDRVILNVRPGVTGLASLKYRNEEYILAQHSNPLAYNDDVIWPDKIRINKWYVIHRSTWMDVQILFYTFVPRPFDVEYFIENWKKKD